jgi:diaminohydroxyphosphoribosylaminopyrimidine deaminase/5-amino-6-(5-phosphoribosylamino)uracil reductase
MSPRATALDGRFMERALTLAARGRPSPNPHVGAVLTKKGRVLAEGWHQRAGDAHAEVVAIERAGRRARGATLYVTFEPCNHWGRTGPCTEAILRSGVRRVVIGCRDPAPHVPGAIRRLRRNGVEVTVGVHRREAERLIADFEKHITTGLPYVTVKIAVTLDGRIATRSGESKWITGVPARKEAHRLRDASDAVLVGVGTVLADDPRLTVRHVRGTDPLRAVVDSRLRTPPGAQLLRARSKSRVLIFHGPRASKRRARALAAAGAELVEVRATPKGVDLGQALLELGTRDVVRLLVEGGGRLHGSLLREGWADRAAFFVAPHILGDAEGVPAVDAGRVDRIAEGWTLVDRSVRQLGDDLLVTGELARGRRAGPR